MLKELNKEKRWIVKAQKQPGEDSLILAIARELNLHPVLAQLLYHRGYKTADAVKSFLCVESEILRDPFLLKDVTPAVERILSAVRSHEKITVYGDYDVDGVTSVCTMYLYLRSIGADVAYYIPNRTTDGYGVSTAAMDALTADGTKLIITVDTGITANAEVDYAKTLGIDFVITDHHECHVDLPNACAVVNPHRPDCPYPFKELAGVGVVFKVIIAIEQMRTGDSAMQVAARCFDEYADLVAIGTIADVMPICDENRLIVWRGLWLMQQKGRVGLDALMEVSSSRTEGARSERAKKRPQITSGYIGYSLAPRINAAGRLLSASIAVELFLETDYNRAVTIAEELCAANKERQNEENKIIKTAYQKMEDYLDAEKYPVIVLDADNWHHGVIGIVASRLTEKYCRPAILVSFDGNEKGAIASADDVGKGSGRSIKGLNLVEALCHCSDTLVKFGGHELAAGLSVTRGMLPAFREKINEYAKSVLTDEDMTPTLEADEEIAFSDVTLKLAEELQKLEPCGVGNPMPTFMVRGVHILEMTGVSDGKHTRFSIGDGSGSVTAMFFSNAPSSLSLGVGDAVDVLFTVDINEWYGRRTVQMIVKDIRLSGLSEIISEEERKTFAYIWSGGTFSEADDYIPTRDDFATVYRMILASVRAGTDTLSHAELMARLGKSGAERKIGYVKLKIIIKVLMELNIIGIEENEEVYSFSIRYSSGKTDLDKSTLLRRLRTQQRAFASDVDA